MKCALLLTGFISTIAMVWAQPQKIAHQMDTFATFEQCAKALSGSRQAIQEAALDQTEGLVEQMNEAIIEEGLDFNITLRVEDIRCELAAKDELGAAAAPAAVATGLVLLPVVVAVSVPTLFVGIVGIELSAINRVIEKVSSNGKVGILQRLQNATKKALGALELKFEKMAENTKRQIDRIEGSAKAVTGYTITVHFAVEQN